MGSMFESYVSDMKRDEFEKTAVEKTAVGRPMAGQIKAKMKPQLIISYNPQNQKSQMMVKRLDNILGKLQGLERMQITALNEMIDQAAIKELGAPKMGLTLMVRGKTVATLEGLQTEMGLRKFFNENRGKMV